MVFKSMFQFEFIEISKTLGGIFLRGETKDQAFMKIFFPHDLIRAAHFHLRQSGVMKTKNYAKRNFPLDFPLLSVRLFNLRISRGEVLMESAQERVLFRGSFYVVAM